MARSEVTHSEVTQLMLPGFTAYMPGQIVHWHRFSDLASESLVLKTNDVVIINPMGAGECEAAGHVFDVVPNGCGRNHESVENYVNDWGYHALAVDNESFQQVINEWRGIYTDCWGE